MTEEKKEKLLVMHKDKIPPKWRSDLCKLLDEADDDDYEALLCAPLYSPWKVFLNSVFLTFVGIDRMGIGDVAIGLCKLLLGWATLFIWPGLDIYLCYHRAMEKNMDTLDYIVHGDDSDENYMTFSERKKWESRPDPYANGGYPEYPGEYPDESDGGEE